MSDVDERIARAEREERRRRRRGAAWWWWSAVILIFAILGGALYNRQHSTAAVKDKIENAYVFRIEGKDSQNRRAAFDLMILTNDFTWVKGSESEVALGGVAIPAPEASSRIFTPQIRAALAKDSDLIAIGLASSEGDREREEARASARAQTEANWLKDVAGGNSSIWTLTLGQYNKSCKKQEDADTSFERPVIIAGVALRAEGTDLREALANAISGHDNLPSRECYSRFDITKAS